MYYRCNDKNKYLIQRKQKASTSIISLRKRSGESFIQLRGRTKVDIFQMDNMGDRGVISGRGSHIKKALRNDIAWLILFKEW